MDMWPSPEKGLIIFLIIMYLLLMLWTVWYSILSSFLLIFIRSLVMRIIFKTGLSLDPSKLALVFLIILSTRN